MTFRIMSVVSLDDDAVVELAAYMRVIEPLLESFGGRIVNRFPLCAVPLTAAPPRSAIIVAFPDRQASDAFFASPKFASVAELHARVFPFCKVTMIEGEPCPPSSTRGSRHPLEPR